MIFVESIRQATEAVEHARAVFRSASYDLTTMAQRLTADTEQANLVVANQLREVNDAWERYNQARLELRQANHPGAGQP